MNNKLNISILFLGIFIFSNIALQCQNLLLKAKGGNIQAQYELATQYYDGIGQIQSYKDAFVWYKKAAEKNHVESCYRVGEMYE